MRKEVVKLLLQHNANTLVHQYCLQNALDLLERAWHNISEDWEFTDDDDVAHFAEVRDCKEGIEQLLLHAGQSETANC